MIRTRIFPFLLSMLFFVFFLPGRAEAQSLSSGNANFKETTAYPTFPTNDPIWYFCSQEGVPAVSLTAQSAGTTVAFVWEKFDPATVTFRNYANDTGVTSTKNQLTDGCYRVSFSENGKNFQFRAWVMNGWSGPSAAIALSTCTLLKLSCTVAGANYQYYDLTTGKPVPISADYHFRWYSGTDYISSLQNPTISNPPSKNTVYRVEVTDRAGCLSKAEVNYVSPIPVAKFSWSTPQKMDPQYVNPQAPADIDFKNLSENADPDKYEWYLFKDKYDLESMGGSGTASIDSFMTILYDVNPLYTYQLSGKYKVKLVASKTLQALTCRDTFYLPDYIVVDTSLVKVTPVFTPNGDGVNDILIIKTRSLESLEFTVLNRWGKVVHHFSTNNYLPENSEVAAWDGRVNGNLCTPGVYFYVVDAQGRDGVRRRSKGFVEMIW
jgi:gliding motility-associated-like protein